MLEKLAVYTVLLALSKQPPLLPTPILHRRLLKRRAAHGAVGIEGAFAFARQAFRRGMLAEIMEVVAEVEFVQNQNRDLWEYWDDVG